MTIEKMQRLISLNNVVCVQFRPRISSDVYYITIRNSAGCSSYVNRIFLFGLLTDISICIKSKVGQNTGTSMERTVSLQHPGCISEGIIMHELIHALGILVLLII